MVRKGLGCVKHSSTSFKWAMNNSKACVPVLRRFCCLSCSWSRHQLWRMQAALLQAARRQRLLHFQVRMPLQVVHASKSRSVCSYRGMSSISASTSSTMPWMSSSSIKTQFSHMIWANPTAHHTSKSHRQNPHSGPIHSIGRFQHPSIRRHGTSFSTTSTTMATKVWVIWAAMTAEQV